MKANELMIGDWVRGFVPDSNSTIYGIFNEQRIAIIAEPSKSYIELSIDDIQPIPLTPEILKKNEFVIIGGTGVPGTVYSWVEDMCAFPQTLIEFTVYDRRISDIKSLLRCSSPYKPGSGRNEIHICGNESVHELQHALRLCRIEKEIVL